MPGFTLDPALGGQQPVYTGRKQRCVTEIIAQGVRCDTGIFQTNLSAACCQASPVWQHAISMRLR
ncbi:MAG: hypothetical protein CL798_07510 [Chromatiales bacterium]|jgi:hypothetical protein|nr:hypothetical protein [Chromatiales bacterium]